VSRGRGGEAAGPVEGVGPCGEKEKEGKWKRRGGPKWRRGSPHASPLFFSFPFSFFHPFLISFYFFPNPF
jgi:hypothetical protein